jgi:sigma-B regulation protein RsbU (phosphoserine phosphatase)
MIPAKEVGGDFYDFYKIGDNKIAFLVADVSGKGIPAAMFMMKAKIIIKDLAESGLPIEEIFSITNEKLCENNITNMFVTAWMGTFDLDTKILEFANAGHNPLIIFSEDKYKVLKSKSDFILGGMEGIKYKSNKLNLKEGQFTSDDGLFTVETVSCLGACGLAPVIVINEKVYPKMTSDAVKTIIDTLLSEERK